MNQSQYSMGKGKQGKRMVSSHWKTKWGIFIWWKNPKTHLGRRRQDLQDHQVQLLTQHSQAITKPCPKCHIYYTTFKCLWGLPILCLLAWKNYINYETLRTRVCDVTFCPFSVEIRTRWMPQFCSAAVAASPPPPPHRACGHSCKSGKDFIIIVVIADYVILICIFKRIHMSFPLKPPP